MVTARNREFRPRLGGSDGRTNSSPREIGAESQPEAAVPMKRTTRGSGAPLLLTAARPARGSSRRPHSSCAARRRPRALHPPKRTNSAACARIETAGETLGQGTGLRYRPAFGADVRATLQLMKEGHRASFS